MFTSRDASTMIMRGPIHMPTSELKHASQQNLAPQPNFAPKPKLAPNPTEPPMTTKHHSFTPSFLPPREAMKESHRHFSELSRKIFPSIEELKTLSQPNTSKHQNSHKNILDPSLRNIMHESTHLTSQRPQHYDGYHPSAPLAASPWPAAGQPLPFHGPSVGLTRPWPGSSEALAWR